MCLLKKQFYLERNNVSEPTIFRFAVNTNSLPKTMAVGKIADLCVEVGADGIEWDLPSIAGLADAAKERARAAADHGLGVAGYTCAGHLWKTDMMRRLSEALATAGIKRVRVDPPWMAYNFDEALHQRVGYVDLLAMTRKGLEDLVPLSKEYGIRYLIETHKGNVAAAPAAPEKPFTTFND